MWKVYFLKAEKKKWYYVGSTNDMQRRYAEHMSGKVAATKPNRPLAIVYTEECNSEADARAFEKRIKSQRLLKEQIIRTIEQIAGSSNGRT